jgi:predicted TIM-barrel fold metal-dependent hydrolase
MHGDLACSGFLDSHSKLTVQIANLGGTIPFLLQRMQTVGFDGEAEAGENLIARLRRCYVNTASFGARAVGLALRCFGEDRVLLGTDCPIFSMQDTLASLGQLSKPVRSAVLENSARRLLRLN